MADYGLLVENDDGYIQLSEESEPFVLHDSGTGTLGVSTTVSTSIDHPLVFIRPSSTWVTGHKALNGGPSFSGRSITVSGDYSGTYQWRSYVQGTSGGTPTSDYGLEIYNASSDLIFSSDYYMPRVHLLMGGQMPYNGSQTVTTSAPPWCLLTGFVKTNEVAGEGQDPGEKEYQAVYWYYGGTKEIGFEELSITGGSTNYYIPSGIYRYWPWIL